MKRPWEVTFLGCGFIALGGVSGLAHAWRAPFDRWLVLIELVQVWAVIGGAFLMLGRRWARWAILLWLAFHVYVGALHSVSTAMSHAVLAAAIAYALLRRPAADYFRQATS